ncbi:hypothetical protein TELCIR_15498 [Teladorsagia circumcincta]|uniref:Uncharacterized protein n=1 Tax=Teladorsagia circumcincta TaxID=45464 RepID=A0A2G9TY54_TELCI|nr:hypothetical protein TELCIR_15498 [Teladorsagia circumcincta]
MSYATVVTATFLFATCVQAQFDYNPWGRFGPDFNPGPQSPYQNNGNNRWNPFSPNFDPVPHGGVFDPNWGKNLENKIKQEVKDSLRKHGQNNGSGSTSNISGININTENGQTVVSLTINGKRFMATFPEGTSISTSTRSFYSDGQRVQETLITVNGVTYILRTINGQTTAVGSNNPFHATSR